MTSYFDMIPSNNIHNYTIWHNGQDGAILDLNNDGIYRFVETKRNENGDIEDYDYDINKKPIVAVGIVAYWLKHRKNANRLLEALSMRQKIIEDFCELFVCYTADRFNQFTIINKNNPDTWDWDWQYEFYSKFIIPHEMRLNKQAEALFEYISDDDISFVRSLMRNYIAFLKKTRSDEYFVSKELMVLRAINSGDEYQYEDLEEYEKITIFDELEEMGYIQVAWIEGHRYEGVRLLDRGKVYLKELEERKGDIEEESIPESEAIVKPERTFEGRVFNNILNERKIIKVLLQIDRLGMGQKQFAFATKEFFREIGWLSTQIDTHYVAWMKNHQIIKINGKDLQHVTRSDKTDALKDNLREKFQFLNSLQKWEDNRDFYLKKDSLKINNGL